MTFFPLKIRFEAAKISLLQMIVPFLRSSSTNSKGSFIAIPTKNNEKIFFEIVIQRFFAIFRHEYDFSGSHSKQKILYLRRCDEFNAL